MTTVVSTAGNEGSDLDALIAKEQRENGTMTTTTTTTTTEVSRKKSKSPNVKVRIAKIKKKKKKKAEEHRDKINRKYANSKVRKLKRLEGKSLY